LFAFNLQGKNQGKKKIKRMWRSTREEPRRPYLYWRDLADQGKLVMSFLVSDREIRGD
jgi:hypothetical protein